MQVKFWGALAAVLAVHITLMFYFERPSLIFNDEPNAWMDYDTHIEQAWRAVESLDKWGKGWSYDPYLLAGNPNGTLFAIDNHAWNLWTFALYKLGVSKGMAFNLFILLSHMLAPWVVFATAMLFGTGRWPALIAASLGMCFWYFDNFPRWMWWGGMIAFGMSGYLVVLSTGLFYRYLKGRRLVYLPLLGLAMGLTHLIHPLAFVSLVVPMMVLYFQHFKALGLKGQLGVTFVVLTVLAINSYWIIPVSTWRQYILAIDDGIYAQGLPSFLLTDFFGLLKDPMVTGFMITRTGFRFIAFVAALFCLISWRKTADDRFWVFAAGIGSLLVVAYFGTFWIHLALLQPYRFVMPAMYLAAIPAGKFIYDAAAEIGRVQLPKLTYATGCLGLVMVTGNLARDVLYFFPGLLPDPHLQTADIMAVRTTNPEVKGAAGQRQMAFRHEPTFNDYSAIANIVKKHDDGSGRILVEHEVLGEHLAWRTKAQILGGFRLRSITHSAANLFRRYDEKQVSEEEARRFLEDYAVKWVIVSGAKHEFETLTDLIELKGVIRPSHRFYRTKTPLSFFAQNHGEVQAAMNRIQVFGTNPTEDVVLRYHFHETLVCKPGCALKREPIENDPVGFIRVKTPHPADFTIENAY